MSRILPDTPRFDTPVYGTVFAARSAVVRRLRAGDAVLLVPDPPGVEQPSVWVHAVGGDVVGHLAPDINRWMAPAMLEGRRYSARVRSAGGDDVPSFERLIVEVIQIETSPER